MPIKIIKFSIILFSFFSLIITFNFADAKQCFLNNECAEDEFCFQYLQKECKWDSSYSQFCPQAESSAGVCTAKLPPGSDCVQYYGDIEKGYCKDSFISAIKAFGPQHCKCIAYAKEGELCGTPDGKFNGACMHQTECAPNSFCTAQNNNDCGVCKGTLTPIIEEKIKFAPIAPTLEIKIPTLQPFTTEGLEKPDAEGNIYFPFIGQYIVGIYKWMLLVAGIIATIMIILGGFTYLTSGGNATQAGAGKERIGAAIFGLILLLGSYMLLYLINPGLVEFRSLKIKVIERTPIESMVFGEHNPAIGSSKVLDATDYDATFQAFASCSGIDWHFYKVVAFKESGLNNTILGSTYKGYQYTGLFQVYPPYCKNVLGKVKWDSYCDSPGLTNPGVNNAYAALLSDANIAKVENKCPNAQIADKFAMLYVGHNCGPGALSSLLQKGCDFNQWLAAPPDNCKKGKMDLAKNIAGIIMGLGVTNFKTTPDLTKCPFNNGMPLL